MIIRKVNRPLGFSSVVEVAHILQFRRHKLQRRQGAAECINASLDIMEITNSFFGAS